MTGRCATADPAFVASVVVPTYNRAHLLGRLFDALAAQEGVGPFELIVVDNASTDDTPAVLARLAAESPLPVVTLHMPVNAGPSKARNVGWRAGRAEIVAFTDDDCVPQPGWLASLLARFETADVVQGHTEPDPADGHVIGPFGRTVIVRAEHGHYETCNLAYRRDLLERLDGFDEQFHRVVGGPVTWGDDADMGWRARKAGARTAFADDALVLHGLRPSSFRRHLREIPRRDGLVLMLRRHPDLRDFYYRKIWFSRTHPAALATAGLALGLAHRPRSRLRWCAAAVSAGMYTRACLSTRHWPARRRDWVTQLPLAFVADLAEVAVFARASLRYRTLFL
jgi:glycosyltransferase involved in cell wall biosynthesis